VVETVLGFVVLLAFVNVSLAELQHAIEEPGQGVGHGGNGFGSAKPSAQATGIRCRKAAGPARPSRIDMTAERTGKHPRWKDCTLWKQLETYSGGDCDEVRASIELVMGNVVKILDKAETAPRDFTLHDSEHSYRVAKLMTKVVPAVLPQLSIYECTLLLLSAYLHDIGMTPERARITAHFEYLLTGTTTTLDEVSRAEFEKWLRLSSSVLVPISRDRTTTLADLRQAREIITYYCRARHNDWSEEWIRTNLSTYPFGSS